MSRITLDTVLKAKLNGLTEQKEVCDENGNTVGHFLPDDQYRELVYGWLRSHWTEEKLAELQQQSGGSSLKEIWQRLGRK